MWAQAEVFKRHLASYRKATGLSAAAVAEELGTTYGNLRFWMTGTRSPKRENLVRIAELFGCSITEFLDDPGMVVDGLAPGDAAQLTPAKRSVVNMFFQRVKDPALSDDQAVKLLRVVDATVEGWK